MNKDMLNEALEKALTESYEELTGQDIPEYDFSDGFREKMAGLISEQDGTADKKRRRGIILFFAAAAAVAVICAWAAMGSGLRTDRYGDYRDTSVIQETTSADKNETVTTSVTGGETAVTTAVTSADKTASSAAVSESAGNTPAASITAANNITNAVTSAAAGKITTAPAGRTTAVTAATQPAVTTTSAVSYERSFEMKKLAAFTSAILMASSAVSGNVYASEGIQRTPSMDAALYAENSIEYDSLLRMADGKYDLDLNNDGEFNIFDVYALYRAAANRGASKEMRERCKLNADYNFDSYIEFNDIDLLIDCFIMYSDVKAEYFDPLYYRNNCPDEYHNIYDDLYTAEERITDYGAYVGELRKTMDEPVCFYPNEIGLPDDAEQRQRYLDHEMSPMEEFFFTKELFMSNYDSDLEGQYNDVKRGDNSDRIAWDEKLFNDADYMFTERLFNRLQRLGRGYKFFAEKCDSKTIDLDVNADGVFDISDLNDMCTYNNVYLRKDVPAEIGERCAAVNDAQLVGIHDAGNKLHDYTIEYFFKFNKLLPEYSTPEFFEGLRSGSSKNELYQEFKAMSEGGKDFSNKKFEKACADFERLEKAGLAPDLDINLDGEINVYDYYDSDIYIYEQIYRISEEDSVLSPKVREHIETNCDFDLNGESGDVYDMSIAQIFVIRHCSDFNGFSDEEYQKYIDSLAAEKKVETENIRYSYTSNISVLSQTSVERSGDANCDGDVDLADAIFIMQNMANPDKYQISSIGRFNADVCETGQGVTVNDALEIQNRLLNK
jgi:hypothetical protein